MYTIMNAGSAFIDILCVYYLVTPTNIEKENDDIQRAFKNAAIKKGVGLTN